MIDSGRWEGFRESKRCLRDTHPESYITKYVLIYEDEMVGACCCSSFPKGSVERSHHGMMVQCSGEGALSLSLSLTHTHTDTDTDRHTHTHTDGVYWAVRVYWAMRVYWARRV